MRLRRICPGILPYLSSALLLIDICLSKWQKCYRDDGKECDSFLSIAHQQRLAGRYGMS